MENDVLFSLMEQRKALLRIVEDAKYSIADIDERIRLAGGDPEPDFSGAVARLRKAGILPSPKK